MSHLIEGRAGDRRLLMGNEAIARGALEAGIRVAAGYPGTPSSEIIENLARVAEQRRLYVEWSVNEKVALEVAAAASFAGLRALCVMKQNGVNVASDFLLHLAGSGTRGGLVLVPCDDPGALSSVNEGESRHFARMIEIPLLEPADFQEAKDMIPYAFALSEQLRTLVMVRSVTRLSHASGDVVLGALPASAPQAFFKHDGFILDLMEGPMLSSPVDYKHGLQQERIRQAAEQFESAPFNTYSGPQRPEVLLITCSACFLYSLEAIRVLGVAERVGVLKLGTTWPLPSMLLEKYLRLSDTVLVVEEVIPFLEENVKLVAAERAAAVGIKTFYGKRDGTLPATGEMNPDRVIEALTKVLGISHAAMPADYAEKALESAFFGAPPRDWTFCPGCPHRASFWSIRSALQMDDRQGFVCGDIGCYSLAMLPTGFNSLSTLHAMGSGTGLASGFGMLNKFDMHQPVLAVSGDSTFFHAVMPALANAVHHRAPITLVVLDNSGTAMTGFQPHPGLAVDAAGKSVQALDIVRICEAMGAEVTQCDPFDLALTQQTLLDLMASAGGPKVLVLKQICALSPEKKGKKQYRMTIDADRCRGEQCGCNRLCTRVFKCPGLIWDAAAKATRIDEVICAGCGVCASICPVGAIQKEAVA
ncbi:thiamine pyrophosphate-dependent enzyme [Desulfatitalea alkaliphila]|uniref:Indolepyruvate oxidoreductase subunit IorA n=1 Tax=Desulfatitalea alkaliphila TaxID=2929485 RepID=A0AA41QZB2_9BACT|nr:thiamine pyrophosphate-dependent enzyme [Desulfatitalea alkaliphila]MCJ8499173.1 thiamine pyrophosphate-dependent enzyme [Desulfatitalea alkaliphila]